MTAARAPLCAHHFVFVLLVEVAACVHDQRHLLVHDAKKLVGYEGVGPCAHHHLRAPHAPQRGAVGDDGLVRHLQQSGFKGLREVECKGFGVRSSG